MRFRKLRIVWSVMWGVAAVLLCVLWVRSRHWIEDAVGPIPGGQVVALSSGPGDLEILIRPNTIHYPNWTYVQEPVEFPDRINWRRGSRPNWHWTARGISTVTPYWLFVVCAALSSLSPWIGIARRFSLRTLLIVTTLIAVVLGLIVYLLRL